MESELQFLYAISRCGITSVVAMGWLIAEPPSVFQYLSFNELKKLGDFLQVEHLTVIYEVIFLQHLLRE